MSKVKHPALLEMENERLREALRSIADLPIDVCITENDYPLSAAKAVALGALSQLVEPAPAQGERDSFERYRLAGEFCASRGIDDDSEIRPKILDAFCSGYACADRPAQTEQQPVSEVLWPDEPGRRGGFSQIGHYDDPRLPVGAKLYAAPIAQTALPPRMEMEPYQTVDRSSTNYKAGWNACRKAMQGGQVESVAQTELVEALREAVEYLSSNKLNSIGSGSAIHRTMEAALTAQGVKQ